MFGFTIFDISSIMSLFTKSDPSKVCSASIFEGCLLSNFFDID